MIDHSSLMLRSVASQNPDIMGLLREHEKDNGELLPHVFLGRIKRWMIEEEVAGQTRAVDAVLDVFDEAYAADLGDVQEMLYVSFLEDLPDGTQIWTRLGPALRSAAKSLWTYDAEDPREFPDMHRG